MRCRAFSFWLNLVWFLFTYKSFIVKNPIRLYQEKISSMYYLHFPFERFVPSHVLKNVSVENIQTIPSAFLSKFSSEIYLS